MNGTSKPILTVVLLAVAIGALLEVVYLPLNQDIQLRVAGERFERNAHHPWLRQWAESSSRDVWDPYLEGRKELLVARVYRAQGRSSEAIEAYREVLEARHDPRVLLEIGLYEWELGRPDAAENHLVEAVRFSQVFLYEIPQLKMRQDVQMKALDPSWRQK